MSRTCEVAECVGKLYARGHCEKHYRRLKKFGDAGRTKGTPHGLTPMERFMRYVQIDEASGCWLWGGSTFGGQPGNRYGQWREHNDQPPVGAHVWLYTQTVGAIPDGLQLDHFGCDRRLCVNPEHLRPVTPWENTLRGDSPAAWNAAKTHCKRGHQFTVENTYSHNGKRLCRTCRAASWRVSGGRKSRARAALGVAVTERAV